jgi:hypothetical protein
LTMTIVIVWYALHGHHPDDVAEHRARAPGTSPKPIPPAPTCSPSCGARSSPRNTCQDPVKPPHQQYSRRSNTHGGRRTLKCESRVKLGSAGNPGTARPDGSPIVRRAS